MAAKIVLIKKYENRRLYDTTNSRYVNLEDVARMLQRGDDVKVIDAASGEDLTRLILTQIIVEDAKTPQSAFPLDFLRQMVIATGQASQESALRYMKAVMDFYQNSYRAMTPPNPFDFMANFAGGGMANARPPVPEPGAAGKSVAEVDELRRRLAELESVVSGIRPGKAAKKKAAKRKR